MTRPSDTGKSGARPKRDLIQRTLSAALLSALAIALSAAGVWPFTIMVAAGTAVLAWEWGRMTRGKSLDAPFYMHAGASVIACGLAALAQPLTGLAVLVAGAAAAALLAPGPRGQAWAAFGVLYLGLPGLLLVLFRSDVSYGLAAILFLFLIVWSTDTAGYFIGRTFGGPKLAPRISPRKTWSGFCGGLLVPALLACGFALWLDGTSPAKLALAGAGLALASQAGDLAESAIKRAFNAKDSGNILPGHGGFFDRVDGLVGAVLAAYAVAAARDLLAPGKGLLIWP